jgi:hypothetical protein
MLVLVIFVGPPEYGTGVGEGVGVGVGFGVGVGEGVGVGGGTTSHSYSCPLYSASWPLPSPYVPEVPLGTTTRSASGLLQFHANDMLQLANISATIAKYFFICFLLVFVESYRLW